jgi:leucine dehydrogenase
VTEGDNFLPLLEAWDGDGVVVRFDAPTGTWIFIALHSSSLGRPTGGTRLRVYGGLRDALRDAMRLAEGMTYKWAGLGMQFGGGKAVLAISRPLGAEERRGLMWRYGELIESLHGAFYTGADLGTNTDDMSHVAQRTRFILGVDPDSGRMRDPGPYTATGVLAGIRSALRFADGAEEVAGRRIVIQGLGRVGGPLARALAAEGARLILCDIDEEKMSALAGELEAETLPADRVYTEPCDVFVPCAIGGVLRPSTIANLGGRIIAGAANNQLLDEDDAERLQKWGILYVPDYIVNAGGAMAFSLMKDGIVEESDLNDRVSSIGNVVAEILEEAKQLGATPLQAAKRRVDLRLARRA